MGGWQCCLLWYSFGPTFPFSACVGVAGTTVWTHTFPGSCRSLLPHLLLVTCSCSTASSVHDCTGELPVTHATLLGLLLRSTCSQHVASDVAPSDSNSTHDTWKTDQWSMPSPTVKGRCACCSAVSYYFTMLWISKSLPKHMLAVVLYISQGTCHCFLGYHMLGV